MRKKNNKSSEVRKDDKWLGFSVKRMISNILAHLYHLVTVIRSTFCGQWTVQIHHTRLSQSTSANLKHICVIIYHTLYT